MYKWVSVLLAMARKFSPAPTLLPVSRVHQQHTGSDYGFSVGDDPNP